VRWLLFILIVACRQREENVDAAVVVAEAGPPPKSVCDLPASCPALTVDAATRITLERSPCFGRCPVYKVTIAGDGTVTWNGTAHVDVGSATAKIPVAKVQELADFLASSCFFSMQDRYSPPVTDLPSATTTVTIGGATKSISHRGAGILDERENRGMTDPTQCRPPKVLAKIDDRIDEIANTEQWIGKREGPPKPVSSADAGPCNPPYTVQSNGTRVFKKECLR